MKVIYSDARKQNITRKRNAQEERFDQTVMIGKNETQGIQVPEPAAMS